MKITREEFMEYVQLYHEAWNNFDKYADIIDSNFLDGLMFPVFNWIDRELGLEDGNGGIVLSYILDGEQPVDWNAVYDEYLGGERDAHLC